MAGIAPLLTRRDHDDLPGHEVPETARTECDHAVARHEPAARGLVLDRQHHQVDGTAEVEVGRRDYVRPA